MTLKTTSLNHTLAIIIGSMIAILFFSLTIKMALAAPTNNFRGGDIFKEALQYLYQNKIAEGYSDGKFHEEYKINRAEFLKMVAKSVDVTLKNNYKKCFPDLQASAWYVPYICSAKDKGWIQGYQDGTFRPEQTVTLIEAVKILLISRGIPLDNYDDHSGIVREWYEQYLPKAYDIGLFSDILEDRPLNWPLYRGEIAQMIYLLDLWDKEYQQQWKEFQNHELLMGGGAGLYYVNPEKYVQPWSMHSHIINYPPSVSSSYRRIGKFYDGNGIGIPLGPDHRDVHRYEDYLTFSYPFGNVLSVNLKTLFYRFDRLPADFPVVYFNGIYYIVKTTDNSELVESHLSTKEFRAIKLYHPETNKIYHVRSKADSAKDDPWNEASVVVDIGILDSGANFLLLQNSYYECHGAGGCLPNSYYYRIDETGVSLGSIIYSNVDKETNELYLGTKIYLKDGTIKEYKLLTGIDEDKFYDGLLNPESQFNELAKQLGPKSKQLYNNFYNTHSDFQPYFYKDLLETQNADDKFELGQSKETYEKGGCQYFGLTINNYQYCFPIVDSFPAA